MTNPMDVYNKIKELGSDAKKDADDFMKKLTEKYDEKHPAPPKLIQQGLESILAKYEHASGTHPEMNSKAHSYEPNYLTGLLGVCTGVALFAAGAYPLGIAAFAASLYLQYRQSPQKTQEAHP